MTSHLGWAVDTERGWRCVPLMRLQRRRQAERKERQRDRDAQWDRQRYTAIQTSVFYPSLIGKLSTVNSALKLDIDPPISSPTSPLSLHLSLSSCGTAHFPFWWFLLFDLVILFLSITLGILLNWDSCHLCILPCPHGEKFKDEMWEWKKWCNTYVQNGTCGDFNYMLYNSYHLISFHRTWHV